MSCWRLSLALDASHYWLRGWCCASALNNRILWWSKTLNCDHELERRTRNYYEIVKLYCDVGNALELKNLVKVCSRSRAASRSSYKSRTLLTHPHHNHTSHSPSYRFLTSTHICVNEKQWLLSTLRRLKRCWVLFGGRWFSARSSLVRGAILPLLPVSHVGTVEP